MTPDDGWFEDEQPLLRGLKRELQRLKRRARARLWLVVLLSVGLTAFALYRKYKKVPLKEASVVLAVTEGTLASGHEPMPLTELQFYVTWVLLSDEALGDILKEEHIPTPLGRHLAIAELRDLFEVNVYRNYFLYQYDIDSPRSARISIVVTSADGAAASHMAHVIAEHVMKGALGSRQRMAKTLTDQAKRALDKADAEADTLAEQVAKAHAALERDQAAGKNTAAERAEVATLEVQLDRDEKEVASLSQRADADEMEAAVENAGLGISFDVVDEQKPLDDAGPPLSFRIIVAGLLFALILPVVAIFIGAFDTRVHDPEDIERINLPVLGHLPGFPGDSIGSLRARGVKRRRVTS